MGLQTSSSLFLIVSVDCALSGGKGWIHLNFFSASFCSIRALLSEVSVYGPCVEGLRMSALLQCRADLKRSHSKIRTVAVSG